MGSELEYKSATQGTMIGFIAAGYQNPLAPFWKGKELN
jgi:hypothetical protein